jgi:hypothetical protein
MSLASLNPAVANLPIKTSHSTDPASAIASINAAAHCAKMGEYTDEEVAKMDLHERRVAIKAILPEVKLRTIAIQMAMLSEKPHVLKADRKAFLKIAPQFLCLVTSLESWARNDVLDNLECAVRGTMVSIDELDHIDKRKASEKAKQPACAPWGETSGRIRESLKPGLMPARNLTKKERTTALELKIYEDEDSDPGVDYFDIYEGSDIVPFNGDVSGRPSWATIEDITTQNERTEDQADGDTMVMVRRSDAVFHRIPSVDWQV